MELRRAAREALCIPDPAAKCAAVHALWARSELEGLALDTAADLAGELARSHAQADPPGEPPGLPGRPRRPRLVSPAQVPQRGVHTLAGRAALLHAIAHIEFNAIKTGR